MFEQGFKEEIDSILGPGVYDIVQENGQRKYGGPPLMWTGPAPPKGCEVFVGRLPRDILENELFVTFAKIGPIYELRLMMDFSSMNRGFAFVTYTNMHDANRAIRDLNRFELRPDHRIGVLKSVDNCRLFIGGIPKNKTQDEVREEMERLTEGVARVIVYSSITDKTKNRGFAFVEYVNHRAASKARRKLVPDRVLLWGQEIAVDWADPEPEIDDDVMSKVTVLYVRNVNLTTTEVSLRAKFMKASNGAVEKLKMMRDFAFVHFSSRESAQRAMDSLNHTEVNGSIIEITWAKPAKDKNPATPTQRRTTIKSLNACVPSAHLSTSQLQGTNSPRAYTSSPPNLPSANLERENLPSPRLASRKLSTPNTPSAKLSTSNMPNTNLSTFGLSSTSKMPNANLLILNTQSANLSNAIAGMSFRNSEKPREISSPVAIPYNFQSHLANSASNLLPVSAPLQFNHASPRRHVGQEETTFSAGSWQLNSQVIMAGANNNTLDDNFARYNVCRTAQIVENQRGVFGVNSNEANLNDNGTANSTATNCLLNDTWTNRNLSPPAYNGQMRFYSPGIPCLPPMPFYGF